MPKCENCGEKFDVDVARSEFGADDEWAGELTYDEVIPEHSICGSCAVAVTWRTSGRAVPCSPAWKQDAPGECVRRLEPFDN